MTSARGSSAASAKATTRTYIDRLLPDATLPRVLIRAAECTLLSELEFKPPVLDLGCGDGSFAAAFRAETMDVGVDPSRKALRYASGLHTYHDLVQALGDRLPFPDASFESILSNSTLEHTPDPGAILRELGRVARPGATCVITVPSEEFPRFLLGSGALTAVRFRAGAEWYGRFMNRVSRHHHIEPPEVWRGWLEEGGFEVEEWRYYFSRRDTMLLDLSHYLSVPSLLTKAVTGRWVLWRGKGRYLPISRALAPFSTPGPMGKGAYLFFKARRRR